MKTIFTILFCHSLFLSAFTQDISITFTGTGASSQIETVKATNQRTNESVTLPGNETLILTVNTGIPDILNEPGLGIIFPNPFTGKTRFITWIDKYQPVNLILQTLTGLVIVHTRIYIQPGENAFELHVNHAGLYMLTMTSEEGSTSLKIICSETTESENLIQYVGTKGSWPGNTNPPGLKASQTGYTLGYTLGDVILYRCKSGMYITIIADSPTASKNYDVEFAACIDPDGKDYSIIKIGTQTWMAENLAYLPSVSPSLSGSDSSPFYYVHGYQGSDVASAKATANIATYGVLYNWEAAKTACPNGWHSPSDAEWTILTDYLTNNGYGYEGSGSDIGKSMASSSGWASSLQAKNIGNNQAANNSSGFNAPPGGYRNSNGSFSGLSRYAYFWSSSESGASYAYDRYLDYGSDGVHRFYEDRRLGYSVRCVRD